MQYLIEVDGVYHTHDHVDRMYAYTTFKEYRMHLHENYAREDASDPLYTHIMEWPEGDVLMCASTSRSQVKFEVGAFDPCPDPLPTHCEEYHTRLWDEGRYSVSEKRDHARHRWGRGGGWKAHRRYQAHDRCK